MKIETTIRPRRDGRVLATISGTQYVFAADENGSLVANIDNDAHLSVLLAIGDFMPANDADFEVAQRLIPVRDDDEQDDGDDADIEAAPPVEGGAPPSKRPPRKVK